VDLATFAKRFFQQIRHAQAPLYRFLGGFALAIGFPCVINL